MSRVAPIIVCGFLAAISAPAGAGNDEEDGERPLVIISGPRNGEFITLPPSFDELSPEVEAAITTLVAAANRMAESAREATAEAKALLLALREAGGEQ